MMKKTFKVLDRNTSTMQMLRSLLFSFRCGYPCPSHFNPADHFIHTLAIVPNNEEECQRRVEVSA